MLTFTNTSLSKIKKKKTWWMVIIVIRELHEAVESLGDEDSVMGFMKAMRTSGG